MKDPEGKKDIRSLLTDLVAKTGENVRVRRFVRYEVGEGLEKRADDFAAEVQEAGRPGLGSATGDDATVAKGKGKGSGAARRRSRRTAPRSASAERDATATRWPASCRWRRA